MEVALWKIVVVVMTTQMISRKVILNMVFAYASFVAAKTMLTASVIGAKPRIVANVCIAGAASMR